MTGSLLDSLLLLTTVTLSIVAAVLLLHVGWRRPGTAEAGSPPMRVAVRVLVWGAPIAAALSLVRLALGWPAPAGALAAALAVSLALTVVALGAAFTAILHPGVGTSATEALAAPAPTAESSPAAPTPLSVMAATEPRVARLILDDSADAMRRSVPVDADEFDVRLMHANRMQSIGRLAGGIAHDFNNLLTSILTSAELAQEALPAEHGVTPDLLEIRRAGTRASELTRQLLAFSRRDVSRPRVIDLNTLVGNLAMMLRRVLGETITLRLTLGNDLPLIHADSAQLEQVIVNLAVNARDAMSQGGELQLCTRRGSPVHSHDELPAPDGVVLEVRDTGVGMSRDVRQRLFEPFFTTKAPGRGTGLGLPTCRSIVAAHGGEITVDSAPNAGATFRVWLPATEEIGEGLASVRHAAGRRALGAAQRSVLFVEDDADVRATTVRVLRAAGYKVLEASDGEDALAQLEHADAPVDLVVADVVMPRMGGAELVRRLRERWPHIRVLYTSGYPGDSPQVAEVESTGELILPKPFTSSILLFEVRLLLDSVRSA